MGSPTSVTATVPQTRPKSAPLVVSVAGPKSLHSRCSPIFIVSSVYLHTILVVWLPDICPIKAGQFTRRVPFAERRVLFDVTRRMPRGEHAPCKIIEAWMTDKVPILAAQRASKTRDDVA